MLRFEKLAVAEGPETPVSDVYRAKVPGGWLIVTDRYEGTSTTFIPDPGHTWDGGSLP